MLPFISIIFAVGLPILALLRNAKETLQRPYLFSVSSLAFCTIAAIAELFAVRQRLTAGDIGGIEDTIGAAIALCIVLTILAVILNLILLKMSDK